MTIHLLDEKLISFDRNMHGQAVLEQGCCIQPDQGHEHQPSNLGRPQDSDGGDPGYVQRSLEAGINAGFQLATANGPLCDEPMWGLVFEVSSSAHTPTCKLTIIPLSCIQGLGFSHG